MKILWVKAGGLYPPNVGGRIRSYQILKELAKQHSVTIFTYYAATGEDRHHVLEREFSRVVSIPLSVPTGRALGEALKYVRFLPSSLPYTVSKFSPPEVRNRLNKLIDEDKPDIIICDFVVAAEPIPWESNIPKVVFTHNVEASIWEQHYRLAKNPVWKWVAQREFRAMERYERTYLNRADHVLTVSEQDRDAIAKFVDPSRITVIPTGVDVDYFRPSPELEETPNSLVFSGAMDWMPNEDGILYFVHEILPLIWRDIPEISLCVVGRDPSRKLRDLAASLPSIQVTGRVEDIRPFVQRGAVYVVPLRIGGGTRLKIFEAMAMGKAVVSTTIGAEGLPLNPGMDVVIADQPQEFADATVALLKDPSRRLQMGRAARALVETQFSWESVVQPFNRVLESIF
ncbi:MAG TPA: glycosyltransferase family 4 protein [Candidatus Acidoferrum sp.]|nr:glycosyltransferase family 4 protein [Candidatus Acidoferrum sp.]